MEIRTSRKSRKKMQKSDFFSEKQDKDGSSYVFGVKKGKKR